MSSGVGVLPGSIRRDNGEMFDCCWLAELPVALNVPLVKILISLSLLIVCVEERPKNLFTKKFPPALIISPTVIPKSAFLVVDSLLCSNISLIFAVAESPNNETALVNTLRSYRRDGCSGQHCTAGF